MYSVTWKPGLKLLVVFNGVKSRTEPKYFIITESGKYPEQKKNVQFEALYKYDDIGLIKKLCIRNLIKLNVTTTLK